MFIKKSQQNNRKRKTHLFCKCGILFQELNNAICQLQDKERKEMLKKIYLDLSCLFRIATVC